MNESNMKTVLVIDDYSMNLKLAEFALKSKYNILAAKSGEVGLKLLASNNVSAILLDILMPEMDGFETYDLIRQNSQYNDIPVCFLTGDTEEASIAKMNELKVPYINKPFEATALINMVDSMISE